MNRTVIIAEAGVNHNGSLELAKELVHHAAKAGADFVKFQTFKAELSISTGTPKAAYQQRTTGAGEDMLAMVRKFELPFEAFEDLARHCAGSGIAFLSTPFDLPSVDLLDHLGMPLFKIPSGEITNPRLLLAAARTGKPTIMSTGMATLGEVERALGVLAFGYIGGSDRDASEQAFANAFTSDPGQAALRSKVSLLHCTTEYPARLEDVNLRAMATLRAAFDLPVGYSDHSLGLTVPVAAVALGATVIEKHFTVDKSLPGPDHQASADPTELAAMVAAIREVEAALGQTTKRPSASESAVAKVARKSLVAARPIRQGDVLTAEDLAIKRPGTGISPLRLYDLVGSLAKRDYGRDELID